LYLQLGHAKVHMDPKDPKSYVELGNQYAEVGDFANAAGAYREAVKLDSSNAAVWADLGGALHMLKRDEEARKALKIALDINPESGSAWRNLGVLQADTKDWQGAIDCFNRALQIEPKWVDGRRYLSVAIEGAGRLSEAAEESRKALEARPLCPECLKLYIHQILRLERRADARSFLLSLIERGTESAPLHNALGELYFYDNLLDEAVAHFDRAGQGGMASAYNNAGVALFRQGRYTEAKAAFERCLTADPSHRGARSNLEKALGRLAHV
jgi:tetratricopeptide (TPR) repeat protein